MKSNELLPFSRNRYYKGKMLTSSDFEAEQVYVNHKRRFVNQMVTGAGIVCGLSVISLDDQSIMIESGMAIDDVGREIVVDSSLVKKLSAVSGFEDLQSNHASLCIRYREEETQPVYAVNRQDGAREYEYNRIEEGAEIFLQDSDSIGAGFEAETEFFAGGVLLENRDYIVRLKLPANLCAGHYVKLTLEAEKCSDEDVVLCYSSMLQTPVMMSLVGAQEQELKLENISLKNGGRVKREYWMLVQKESLNDSAVMLKPGSASATVGGIDVAPVSSMNCKVNVIDEEPEQLAAREAGRMSLEMRNMGAGSGFVELARLVLVRTENAYLIEHVEENSVKAYVPTMRDARQREEFTNYFGKCFPYYTNQQTAAAAASVRDGETGVQRTDYHIETGVVEIPLGDHASRGDVCYSGEIMHGLGKGNVYVQVGLERLENDAVIGGASKMTVYGNAALFSTSEANVAAETAVKVFNDKGSFMVAVRLLDDVDYLLLTYRWIAIRVGGEEAGDGMELPQTDKSISAVTPTVVLGTKETYFFQVQYNHMKPCSISYEMTEPGTGEVTADGIYTAPAKEGVYEIRIFCTDHPLICTYAYAIVKKKSVDELEEKG